MSQLLRQFIRESIQLDEVLKLVDKDDRFDFMTYQMPLRKDRFIHFTTEERAQQILATGKLLMRPPYAKFGTDTVDAVSLRWGSLVPGVQFTHIMKKAAENKEGRIVGIVFKTDVLPKYGRPEEVKWERDVKLINPSVVSFERGQNLLRDTPHSPPAGEDFIVNYKR